MISPSVCGFVCRVKEVNCGPRGSTRRAKPAQRSRGFGTPWGPRNSTSHFSNSGSRTPPLRGPLEACRRLQWPRGGSGRASERCVRREQSGKTRWASQRSLRGAGFRGCPLRVPTLRLLPSGDRSTRFRVTPNQLSSVFIDADQFCSVVDGSCKTERREYLETNRKMGQTRKLVDPVVRHQFNKITTRYEYWEAKLCLLPPCTVIFVGQPSGFALLLRCCTTPVIKKRAKIELTQIWVKMFALLLLYLSLFSFFPFVSLCFFQKLEGLGFVL